MERTNSVTTKSFYFTGLTKNSLIYFGHIVFLEELFLETKVVCGLRYLARTCVYCLSSFKMYDLLIKPQFYKNKKYAYDKFYLSYKLSF